MEGRRRHRCAHPEDRKLFCADAVLRLRAAVADLAWLLTNQYPRESSLKLVGDRYRLRKRQRIALGRITCSDQSRAARFAKERANVKGAELIIDGYNLLTTIESALGGGVILGCRDGTLRDMASTGGTWRASQETFPSIGLMLEHVLQIEAAKCTILLDRPISNSRRLAQAVLSQTQLRGIPCDVALEDRVDSVLRRSAAIVVSADSGVLDGCSEWYNFAREVITQSCPGAWIIEMDQGPRCVV